MKHISTIYLSLLVLVLLSLSACTDVVKVDVPNGGNRLVVEASILWVKGTAGNEQSIYLSTSSPYFEQNTNTPVTGAAVTVTKINDGTQITFTDQNNGKYTTDAFVTELNATYKLSIEYNGNTYQSTETLIPVATIHTIEQSTENGFNNQNKEIIIYFDDPADEENFYLTENQASFENYKEIKVYSDGYVNGNTTDQLFEKEKYETGVTVDLSLQGISKGYYNFMNILLMQSQSGGSGPFTTTPLQLKGNCKNINNTDEEVLGYFRLSEVENRTVVIE